jgi:hypothetical protein
MNINKLAFFAVATLVAGCEDDDFDDRDFGGDDGNPPATDGGPTAIEWHATLQPTEVGRTIQGDAVVRMKVGEPAFTAAITVRTDTPGAIRPWHVHYGDCRSGGGIVGSDEAYPRLAVGTDGVAMSDVLIRIGLDPAAAYHVNVHCSDAEFDRIIACGDLVVR